MYMWTTNVNTSFFNLDMSMDSSPSYSKSRHTSLVLASRIREPPSYGLHTTWRHHSLVLPMKPSMNPQNDFLLQTHLPGSSLSGEGCGGGPISWFLLLVSISLTSRTTDGGDGTHFIQQFFCFLPRKLINKFLPERNNNRQISNWTNIEEFKNDKREKHILLHVNLLAVALWLHSKWSCWRFSSSLSSSCLAWNTRLPLLVPRPLPWPLPFPTDVEGGESDSVVTWSINMYNLVNSWK